MKRLLILLLIGGIYSSLFAQEVDSIIDVRDGQVYKIVKIGNQWWMAENLKATSYSDGTPLINGSGAGDITFNDSTKYYFWYENDSINYADTYGALYTWAAAMNGASSSDSNPSGVQGVCPTGFHLPSDAEWKEMELFLGMNQYEVNYIQSWRGTDEGGKLKEIGNIYWRSPNTGATNSTGFSAISVGYRSQYGPFTDLGIAATFWSSTEYQENLVYGRLLNFAYSQVYRDRYGKDNGMPVRCVTDTLVNVNIVIDNYMVDEFANIYPNPIVDKAIIEIPNPDGNKYTLYIRDLTGKLCHIVNDISASEYVLERGNLNLGLYFIELKGPKVYRGKIIIE